MDVKLDWLSFTVPVDNWDAENDLQATFTTVEALKHVIGEDGYDLLRGEGDGWTPGKGRKPYSASLIGKGVRIFYNHRVPHVLVEISGEGCARIFSQLAGSQLLQDVSERITRCDIAVDIETNISPSEFVTYRDGTRHKSFQHILSQTGETCYIGSQTSNRYCRVYKYEEPHPRAGLLRVEHVFRQEDARKVIAYGFERGVYALAQQCALVYGWKHEVWQLEPASERELKAHRVERTEAGTLKWLLDSVVPAVGRMWKEGRTEDVKTFMYELGKVLSTPDANPVDQLTD